MINQAFEHSCVLPQLCTQIYIKIYIAMCFYSYVLESAISDYGKHIEMYRYSNLANYNQVYNMCIICLAFIMAFTYIFLYVLNLCPVCLHIVFCLSSN